MKRTTWAMRQLAMTCIALSLVHCSDPQSEALKQLTTKGYSLSVAEFFKAAEAGDIEALKLFVAAGVEPNVRSGDGTNALNHAARAGKPEVIEGLMALGAMMPFESSALLGDAVRSHSVATLRLLIDARVKPEKDTTHSPLAVAATEKQHEMMELLLPLCAGHEDTALIAGAGVGDVTTMSLLLHSGASVFGRELKTQRTALMEAATGGHEKAVEMLLAAGANRWALDSEGFVAGEKAQAALHIELANALLAAPSAGEQVHDTELKGRSLAMRLESMDSQLFFLGCRERALPFMLTTMDETGATMRLPSGEDARVEIGAAVPGSSWKLEKPKLGGVVAQNADSRERVLLMPNVPARSGALVAVLRDEATQSLFEAAAGDEFSIEADSQARFSVKSVTPLKVVIADQSSPPREWVLKLGKK